MSHETKVYGFIEGATWQRESYRLYQNKNIEIISQLPEEDEWPYLTSKMFGCSNPDDRQTTFRRHLIHFGATIKGLECEYIEEWILKFEGLLNKLYWYTAVAHIKAEIHDEYSYHWRMEREFQMIKDMESLPPTTTWHRKQLIAGNPVGELNKSGNA